MRALVLFDTVNACVDARSADRADDVPWNALLGPSGLLAFTAARRTGLLPLEELALPKAPTQKARRRVVVHPPAPRCELHGAGAVLMPKKPSAAERWLTAQEAADRLRIALKALYNWASACEVQRRGPEPLRLGNRDLRYAVGRRSLPRSPGAHHALAVAEVGRCGSGAGEEGLSLLRGRWTGKTLRLRSRSCMACRHPPAFRWLPW